MGTRRNTIKICLVYNLFQNLSRRRQGAEKKARHFVAFFLLVLFCIMPTYFTGWETRELKQTSAFVIPLRFNYWKLFSITKVTQAKHMFVESVGFIQTEITFCKVCISLYLFACICFILSKLADH